MYEPPLPSGRRSRIPAAPWCVLLAGVALLQGCSALRGRNSGDADAGDSTRLSFRVEVLSDNRRIARHLERYLDIQRFADFPDLQPNELRRLLGEVESNARDLLAAQGYFNPQLDLKAGDAEASGDRRRIVIQVNPGEETRVESHAIRFNVPTTDDADGASQRRSIERDWLLNDGATFTQAQWNAAKAAGLRVLQRERHPTARIADSKATINADTNRATLDVTYDTGPAYRFGALRLEGVERYDATGIHNIARIPGGKMYREEDLLNAQQRLIASGYFESAFLVLDNNQSSPDEAAVVAQLREAQLQKAVFGLGYSTDTGPRLSVDHTHNKMWPLGWRALNQAALGTHTQSLGTNWVDMPEASGWAWNTGLKLERSDVGDIKANSLSLTGGRTRLGNQSERGYFVQYDASNTEGGGNPVTSTSLMGNYTWTGRYFDNRLNPTRGYGIGMDAGAGTTITPRRNPFVRVNVRALKLLPLGSASATSRQSRLALRAEIGAIRAGSNAEIPARLLFLTGGDTTVRGYGYQSIGTPLSDGSIYGARYMAMASVEWQRPVTLRGDARSFEHVLFVDAGAATDKLRDVVVFPGVGTGLRWSSPVGPLQFDTAYGTKTHRWHVHLRVGFQFQ
jgi:translocation and assembly module TamA